MSILFDDSPPIAGVGAVEMEVLKFGGTCIVGRVGLRRCAQIVASHHAQRKVCVVVSAPRLRNDLDSTRDKAEVAYSTEALSGMCGTSSERERHAILAVGETLSAARFAQAICSEGEYRNFAGTSQQPDPEYTPPLMGVSLNAFQAGLRLNLYDELKDVEIERVVSVTEAGQVAVLAGFQGLTLSGDVRTLGSGTSDMSAIALAASLQDRYDGVACTIYTDVAGLYTADPAIVPEARQLKEIYAGEFLEAAKCGATVIHPRALYLAMRYGVDVRIRSGFELNNKGTLITAKPKVGHAEMTPEAAEELPK